MNAKKKTSAQIVDFPSTRRVAFTMPLAKLDSFEGRKALARLMRSWERESKENTFKLLSQRSGLHRKTVERIASEDTTWPRLHTILAIMGGIGFTAVRFE